MTATRRWWIIDERELLQLLYRVRDGDDPDVVYLEAFVNADRTEIEIEGG